MRPREARPPSGQQRSTGSAWRCCASGSSSRFGSPCSIGETTRTVVWFPIGRISVIGSAADTVRRVNDPEPPEDLSPLSGLSVVEMGSGVVVPYVAKMLVDCGATVLKVESPDGDPYRQRPHQNSENLDEDSAWFRYLNAGKSSCVIDLEGSAGRVELASLVASAALVLDDHSPLEAR
ncbi:MAG: CoA transferase, partial [Acidobacteria bacterium]|nr:CoA transferase [Acidobacteriota bacterium]